MNVVCRNIDYQHYILVDIAQNDKPTPSVASVLYSPYYLCLWGCWRTKKQVLNQPESTPLVFPALINNEKHKSNLKFVFLEVYFVCFRCPAELRCSYLRQRVLSSRSRARAEKRPGRLQNTKKESKRWRYQKKDTGKDWQLESEREKWCTLLF